MTETKAPRPLCRTPAQIATEMLHTQRASFEQKLSICQLFAEAWVNYTDGGWGDKKLEDFLSRIYVGGVGPDPSSTILKTHSETGYKISANCGSFYSMLRVGSSELFQDDSVLSECRVGSIATLYALERLYSLLTTPNAEGKLKTRPALAKKRIVSILMRPGETTRGDIEEEIKKLQQQKSDQSLAVAEIGQERTQSLVGATYNELRDLGRVYHSLLLVPSEDVLDAFEQSVEPAFDYGFLDVRDATSQVSIQVTGDRLATAIRWSREALQVQTPSIYCLSDTKLSGRVVDLSEMSILVSSESMDMSSISSKEAISDAVKRITKTDGGNSLLVYSTSEEEGWDTCSG